MATVKTDLKRAIGLGQVYFRAAESAEDYAQKFESAKLKVGEG